MMSNDKLTGLRAFVQAVESGSFSRAAQQLGQSPSSVGKAIARLEQRLDARLFHRTTRRLALTDEGQAFHERCLRAFGELEQAESDLAARRLVPAGRLRVALPVLLGRDWVMPVLLELAARHPALEIDAVFSNRPVDFAEEGFDLAVRIGLLEQSAPLAARRLGEQRLVVCAAPAYLARHGVPEAPEDLADGHACIGLLRDGQIEPWRFATAPVAGRAGTAPRRWPGAARLRLGHLEAVAAAALAGQGLAQLPAWLVAGALADGRLRAVLASHESAPLPIHAVWPATRAMSARLRLVIDTLCASPLPPRDLPEQAPASSG